MNKKYLSSFIILFYFCISLFFTPKHSNASDYETLWYGYNKFLSDPEWKELIIECGYGETDSSLRPFEWMRESFKLIKTSENLEIYQLENTWTKILAEFDVSFIRYETEPDFIDFYELKWRDKVALIKAFRDFIPKDEINSLFRKINELSTNFESAVIEEWNKYFESYTKSPIRHYLSLRSGSYRKDHVIDEDGLKYSVLTKKTTIPKVRSQVYTFSRKIKDLKYYEGFDCVAMKKF